MSQLSTEKFQRWIREELDMKKPPSEAKLAKICKGTLASLWQQLVDNYTSKTTQKGFYNSFLMQENNLRSVHVDSKRQEQNNYDEESEEWKYEMNDYKQRLSVLEKDIYSLEQQIQLVHCRQTLTRRTCDPFSAFVQEMVKHLEQMNERISQYNLIESFAESSFENVNIEKLILHHSDTSSMMNTVSEFVQECMEPRTMGEFLTLLQQLVSQQDMVQSLKQCLYRSLGYEDFCFCFEEYQSSVDNQKLLLWNLQALLCDLRLKYTEYRKQLEEATLDKKYSSYDDCNQRSEEKDWIEACAYGEEEAERMLRNMQQELESNSSPWISDEELEDAFTQLIDSATQLEGHIYSWKSMDVDMQNICNALEQAIDMQSSRQKIQQLCHLSQKAADSMKDLIKLYKEKIDAIGSLEEYKTPVFSNHFVMTDKRMHNEDLDLKDSDALGQLSCVNKQHSKWQYYGDLERCETSGTLHDLLNYVIETQIKRDLSMTSYKARNFEYEMLKELISKEYDLTGMQQQVAQLQQHWTCEISPCIEHANIVLNNVVELLPNIRNLLDVWKSQPGLALTSNASSI
ncbi:hypothetical protein GpartN1_g1330.t1 [Galdieria partita]|uniref:Uncharacterized protein n=1 Tax=Galdieria partita TaxID=83374 RepID=A0A9C7PSA0_9RHOD|nr:hypothetical protein GpartN1_g1330.t1 [Galdieria partita]